MRLVGASNRYIETPFILEGVFAALIGSVLAGGAIVAIVQFFVQGYLQQAVSDTTTFVGLPQALHRRADPDPGGGAARCAVGERRHPAVPQGLRRYTLHRLVHRAGEE